MHWELPSRAYQGLASFKSFKHFLVAAPVHLVQILQQDSFILYLLYPSIPWLDWRIPWQCVHRCDCHVKKLWGWEAAVKHALLMIQTSHLYLPELWCPALSSNFALSQLTRIPSYASECANIWLKRIDFILNNLAGSCWWMTFHLTPRHTARNLLFLPPVLCDVKVPALPDTWCLCRGLWHHNKQSEPQELDNSSVASQERLKFNGPNVTMLQARPLLLLHSEMLQTSSCRVWNLA